jgi:hypothetical protein
MGAHEPLLYWTARHGSWASCTCGRWKSRTWTSVSGAHLEFGQHLLDDRKKEEMIEKKIRAVITNGNVAMNMIRNPDDSDDTFIGTEELMIAWVQLTLAVKFLLGDTEAPDLDLVPSQRAAFYTSCFDLDTKE